MSFIQAPEDFIQAPEKEYFDAAPTMGDQSYQAASGEIFGILTQMKESFEKDLKDSQKEEEEKVKSFEELKALKEEEIAAGQAQVDKKTEELAATDERLVKGKEELKDTKESLTADEEFLMMLKEKCQLTDQEWEKRQKTRTMEMEAVSKALAILSGDDAHDTFTRTFNPEFLQLRSSSADRQRASQLLSAKATQLHSPRLLALAQRVKLDAFTKVKKAIDDVVKALADEQAAEVKKRDWCIDEFAKNKEDNFRAETMKKDVIAKLKELDNLIKNGDAMVAELKSEIAEMEKQLKAASENREAENKDFQQTVADQQTTQKLLKAALEVLQGFYGKFLQTAHRAKKQEPAGPPPPPGFEEYKKSAASGGVMDMIEEIISDAKQMEADAKRDEQEAQTAYEAFTKETNESVEAKSKEVVALKEKIAKAEGDLVEAKEERENVLLELEQLANFKAELKQDCDFLLKNFELRQSARSEEMEALRQAKAILSGSDFASA